MALSKSTAVRKELSLLVPFCGSTSELKSKLGYFASESHPVQRAAANFAEAVKKRTNGEISVKLYPSTTLYSQTEILEKTVLGIIHMCLVTQAPLKKLCKSVRSCHAAICVR
jgi:TRAP-type C4-dicarboxylate transport system substrate-binding protein